MVSQGLTAVAFLAVLLSGGARVDAQETAPPAGAVVHGVFFYSPTCPHCERVIRDVLLPLQDQYGESLVVVALSTATEYGSGLFRAAMERYHVPEGEWGVPFLMVGDQRMMGGLEIPARFPALVDAGLTSGGIDLPDFPELISFLDARGALRVVEPGHRYVFQDPAATPTTPEPPADAGAGAAAPPEDTVATPAQAAEQAVAEPEPQVQAADEAPPAPRPSAEPSKEEPSDPISDPDVAGRTETAEGPPPPALELETSSPTEMTALERFGQDRAGNTLAVVVLVSMIFAVFRSLPPTKPRRAEWPEWVTPVLSALGLAVALYLSYVEVTGNPATCGPVGDCNTVQQSPHATLFGVLHVGVLGVAAYMGILALWMGRYLGSGRLRTSAALGLWIATLGGTVFSAYLTFLEPFVIGATCLWCLTSAVVMTLLMMASLAPVSAVLRHHTPTS